MCPITYPIVLDLPFEIDGSVSQERYSLQAVIDHEGEAASSGHYVTYARRFHEPPKAKAKAKAKARARARPKAKVEERAKAKAKAKTRANKARAMAKAAYSGSRSTTLS